MSKTRVLAKAEKVAFQLTKLRLELARQGWEDSDLFREVKRAEVSIDSEIEFNRNNAEVKL